MNVWSVDPDVYRVGRKHVATSKIVGVRPMEHGDLVSLEQMIQADTYEIFGDLNLPGIYEASCLSVVQCNEKRDIVSGMCLCNYPNVPAVPPQDWRVWLQKIYGVDNALEGNTLFVHFLVWDRRYTGSFFKHLLTKVFDIAPVIQHVILVLPPQLILGDVFEGQMVRMLPRQIRNTYSVQSIYVTVYHLKIPRLKIRRVVEEDNDDVIPIIDAGSSIPKEFYGEYYVSEMVRYPVDHRQVIVSEDNEGLATGAVFLNSSIDVDTLNENFELGPYNGLRKLHKDDVIPPESMVPASDVFFNIFSKAPVEDMPVEDDELPELPSSSTSIEGFEEGIDSKSLYSVTSQNEPVVSPSDHSKSHASSKIKSVISEETESEIPSIEVPEALSFEEIWLPPQPTYRGEVNSFVVEIFAMREEVKHRWGKNFLEAAFECFPHLDYCAILLPFSHAFLPFLDHFVRVPLRYNKDYPMSLYVTHRAALLGQMNCREASPDDLKDVQELLKNIPKMEAILADFSSAVHKESNLLSYVFLWNDKIVGVTVLCAEKDATFIKRRYHVEDYISIRSIPQDMYGRILHFVLMPVFSVHLRTYFCEIMRLSNMTVLYYRLTERDLSALTRSQPLAICLNAMVSVHPRQIEYKYQGFIESDEPANESDLFSLFMTTPRLAAIANAIVDTKIVVVGASDCGVGFIECLALGHTHDFTRFANLTLISPNGLPFENDCTPTIKHMLPFKGKYCREYRQRVATRAWINIIYGTVISINRQEKYVTVLNQGNITYDYLILTCGLQYQRPQFQKELGAQKKGVLIEHETPWNCITINNDAQAEVCLEKIRILTNNFADEKKIIFYGVNIDCYCALQALFEAGLKGSSVILLRPPLQKCETFHNVFFADCEVHTEVLNCIAKEGVEVILEWELEDWRLTETKKGKMIKSLVLQWKGKTRLMDCDALVNFNEKTINMKIFLAICRAGLVFDGQLVIDQEFRTNDPSIFAAGTITKYRRKFHAEIWQHKYYNSVEIGERLATVIRNIIRAEQTKNEVPEVDLVDKKTLFTLPNFRIPVVIACHLPGGNRYLHIRKPGKIVLRQLAIRYHFYGVVMVTGSCSSDTGYFRLRLDNYDTVQTITCFSKQDYEVHHMISLYGKHESLLNELKTRFQQSLIVDFYEYFREPWAVAIFYDRFECLRVENRATLLSKTAIPGQSLIDDCTHALIKSKWEKMEDKDRRYIESKYVGSVYQQELEESLMDFLQFAEQDIPPVYCTPGKLHELYDDTEDSPLYTNL